MSNRPIPLINIKTNIADVQALDTLLRKLSVAHVTATGKPQSYVMTLLDSCVPMTLSGSEESCAYVKAKSIRALTPPAMSDQFVSYASRL